MQAHLWGCCVNNFVICVHETDSEGNMLHQHTGLTHLNVMLLSNEFCTELVCHPCKDEGAPYFEMSDRMTNATHRSCRSQQFSLFL